MPESDSDEEASEGDEADDSAEDFIKHYPSSDDDEAVVDTDGPSERKSDNFQNNP